MKRNGEKTQTAAVGLTIWASYFEHIRSESPSPKALEPLWDRFMRFATDAVEDLDYLSAVGANPAVLVHICYVDQWLGSSPRESAPGPSEDARRITSAKFWTSQRARMETASLAMKEFRENHVYREWDQFYRGRGTNTNLKRVFAKVHAAAEAVEGAIKTIDELNLQSGTWEVRWDFKGPRFIQTHKRGRQKSGPHQRDIWGSTGAGLVYYLRKRTGQPHYARVCRLLAAAGIVDFTNGRQSEVDVLRKAIGRIESNDAAMYALLARLSDCEYAFEPREPIPTGADRVERVDRLYPPDEPSDDAPDRTQRPLD